MDNSVLVDMGQGAEQRSEVSPYIRDSEGSEIILK